MPLAVMLGGGVCLVAVARAAANQKHALRAIFSSVLCGVGALAAVALLEPWTGVSLPLNWFTAFLAAVLGLPGIVMLLLADLML